MLNSSNRDYDMMFGAVEQSDGSYIDDHNDRITWYNEAGAYHREDGPALITMTGAGWYLNDDGYSFDDWLIKLNKSDETKLLLRLQYA
jgi:hypothetical protein